VNSVTDDDLRRYLHKLNEERKLSVATVKRRFATLRGLYRWLERADVIENPFARWVPRLKRPRRLPKAITRIDLRRLISRAEQRANAAAHGKSTRLALMLMAGTGLRVGELCSLNLDDLAADGKSLRVSGKGARDRIVFVSNSDL